MRPAVPYWSNKRRPYKHYSSEADTCDQQYRNGLIKGDRTNIIVPMHTCNQRYRIGLIKDDQTNITIPMQAYETRYPGIVIVYLKTTRLTVQARFRYIRPTKTQHWFNIRQYSITVALQNTPAVR